MNSKSHGLSRCGLIVVVFVKLLSHNLAVVCAESQSLIRRRKEGEYISVLIVAGTYLTTQGCRVHKASFGIQSASAVYIYFAFGEVARPFSVIWREL